MKKYLLPVVMVLLFFTSCQNSGNQTWDNVKTAGRYLNRSIDALMGKDYDSRMVGSAEDFQGPEGGEFIALRDDDLQTQFRTTDLAVAQAQFAPGEHGVPAMYQFRDPSGHLQGLFKTIHFDTDDHVVRSHDDLNAVAQIAGYMKKHPNAFLCVEGHCDERASAAYNMALGTRRANHIRVLLIKQGVDFNRIYTISYGKEKPITQGRGDESWRQNRRAQFKLYQK